VAVGLLLDTLRQLKEPELAATGAPQAELAAQEEALAGRFLIFNRVPEHVSLVPPIDWDQDPFDSPSWQAQLHMLKFLGILFRAAEAGTSSALPQALEIGLDWILSNHPGTTDNPRAWGDKIVGDRAPFLAYLLRMAGAQEILTEPDATELLNSVVEHGNWLGDDDNYNFGSNHGLMQDVGLVRLTTYIPFADEAGKWRSHAVARFVDSLRLHTSAEDGVYLEHSPAYHVMIANIILKLRRLGVSSPDLDALHTQMQETARWLVKPDGSLAPVGDTDPMPAPKWAQTRAATTHGLRVFPSGGFGAVREGQAYLLLSAGYHSKAHKQADDLSFVLHDRGVDIIGEAGKYGYLPSDPGRIYALSGWGHNVLLVDDQDAPWKKSDPYGSGIRAGGSGSGWYALLAVNPMLETRGVQHERTLLFRPGQGLIVIDRVSAPDNHVYTRLLHLASGLEAQVNGNGVEFAGENARGRILDHSDVSVSTSLVQGQLEPAVRGWTFPGYRAWEAVPTVEFKAEARDAPFAKALTYGDVGFNVTDVATTSEGIRITVSSDGASESLSIQQSGTSLSIEPADVR
jgi:hypothetical protein